MEQAPLGSKAGEVVLVESVSLPMDWYNVTCCEGCGQEPNIGILLFGAQVTLGPDGGRSQAFLTVWLHPMKLNSNVWPLGLWENAVCWFK